jgi:hypothetical protein
MSAPPTNREDARRFAEGVVSTAVCMGRDLGCPRCGFAQNEELHSVMGASDVPVCRRCFYYPGWNHEAERFRDWIERHGGHPQDCAIWVELDDVSAALHPVGRCDCGLSDILGHKTDRKVV